MVLYACCTPTVVGLPGRTFPGSRKLAVKVSMARYIVPLPEEGGDLQSSRIRIAQVRYNPNGTQIFLSRRITCIPAVRDGGDFQRGEHFYGVQFAIGVGQVDGDRARTDCWH